jgi:hypothetical protein
MLRICFCLIVCVLTCPAFGQGLRVEATVSRQAQNGENGEQFLSTSVTLLSSGKAYDFVESADEVIIFKPTAREYVILNMARALSSKVTIEEISHLLASRRSESMKYVQELRQSSSSSLERVSRSLAFQLDPKFETRFDADSGRLTLKADSWKYFVQTDEWQNAAQVNEYLAYADGISQLNYVLHPRSFFPEPRMELNSELRKLGRLPTSVQLDLRPDEALVLKANYKFVRDLNDTDRMLIRRWESSAKNGSLRELPFRSYQEAVLVNSR